VRKQTLTAAAVGMVIFGLAPQAVAASGPMAFEPIAGSAYDQVTASWTEPYVVPDNCTQTMVGDETVLNIYPTADDLGDMNVTNETGQQAGRYLYRTHEVGSNGAVSVVDLKTGESKVLTQNAGYQGLDGLTWTPWGTLLFAEERVGGRLFEIFLDPKDPTVVDHVAARPELGILRHEGIGVAPDGSVFVIDEFNGGAIYKFVPTRRGDLSDGQLYALRLTGLTDAQQGWNQATYNDKVGAFEWVALDMSLATTDAKAAADAVNATEFGRPEDVQIISNVLYVANTSEDRVVAIDLKSNELTSFVNAGANIPVENEDAGVTGLNSPDNLAIGTGGQLWIAEDNSPSDIWVASDGDNDGVADDVELFASLKDPGGESTGIYFGKDPHTLYVNIQHATKPLADGTWAITCN
jgi:secreted PhoX family phosphatase